MIYQIKITLLRYSPKIWRRVLVNSEIKLSDFHKIIQTTMGWSNSHLHQFKKNKLFYSKPFEDDASYAIDYRKMKISSLINAEKDKMVYEYDFGDGWEHEIILEKILPIDPKSKYPVCIDGKLKCPPDDCGGVGGYENLLLTIQDKKNEDYKDMMEWLGGSFDPEEFNMNEINEMLREKNFGMYN